MAGRCDKIEVVLYPDGSVSVQDNGYGVPSQIHHQVGKPTLEVVFSVLHAGGKFGGSGYKISGGLHGVGASVVNALSEWMEIDNCYEGKRYTMRFERGEIARPFACVGETDRHGLFVRFKPDAEIFTDTTTFDTDTLLTRLREQAFLNAGIRIVLRDERVDLDAKKEDKVEDEDIRRLLEAAKRVPGDEEEPDEDENEVKEGVDNEIKFENDASEIDKSCRYLEYDLKYDGGIREFVEHLNKAKHVEVIHPNVIYMKAQKGDITAEVAMQYNDSYTETIVTFANNMSTIDGGTHETGFKTAITKVLNDYARKIGALKDGDKNFSGEDAREGLCAVVSVKLPDAQFESQTKAKLGNSDVKGIVESIVTTKLAEFYEENPDFIRPVTRKNEIVSFVKSGLKDLSISRSTFDWGVPLPFDEGHVAYVWADALLAYLTGIGYSDPERAAEYEAAWPMQYHFVGKDIIRFHCVIWPAMLMAAGMPITHTVFGHGFLLTKGEKMSKSRGNALKPADLVEVFGVDPYRYYFLSDVQFGHDGSISIERMVQVYNADLANTWGNLVSRVFNMTNKYFDGVVPTPPAGAEDNPLAEIAADLYKEYDEAMANVDFSAAAAAVQKLASRVNLYVEDSAPWNLAKSEETADELAAVIYNALEAVRIIALFMAPFMPTTSNEVFNRMSLGDITDITDIEAASAWGQLAPGLSVETGTPLYPRLDVDAIDFSLE